MLKTERMVKLEIVGPKTELSHTIDTCYALKVYHIVDHQKTVELDIGSPLQNAEQLSEIVLKLRGLISHLQIVPNGKIEHIRSKTTAPDYFSLGQKAHDLYDRVIALLEQRKQAQEALHIAERDAQVLEILKGLALEPQDLTGGKRLAVIVGTIPSVKDLRGMLTKITNKLELTEMASEGRNTIAVAVERSAEPAVRQQLSALGFSELDASALVSQTLADARTALRQNQEAVTQVNAALKAIAQAEDDFLLLNESLLTEETRKAEAPLKFGITKSSFLVTGWVPERRLQETVKALNDATHQKIHIETTDVHHEQDVPIAFHNPSVARPFQFFLEMFALPNYHELDPTVLMLFTFPLFFGIMLGDVGYGVISLILFLFLKPRLGKDVKPLLNIMLYAAVLSIVFGFAFGEYLGFEHVSEATGQRLCGVGICLPQGSIVEGGVSETIYDFPRLLSRAHGNMQVFDFSMRAVLVIGAIIGLIHLNLGLILGFINGWHHHGFVHGLMEKVGWFMLEISVATFALAGMGWLFLGHPIPMWAGGVLLVAAAVLLYMGEGIQGLIEMPALFSNTLSYMRLGAVGLASVGLATVVNEKFFLPLLHMGGIYILFGILIMIIGHTINLLLGLIGPFLHSLRLHYVEFFTKFYKGGGVPYTPFGYPDHTQ